MVHERMVGPLSTGAEHFKVDRVDATNAHHGQSVPSVVNQHRSLATRIVEPLAPRACATVPTCHLPDPSLWAAAELASRAAEGRAVRPTS